MRIVRMVALAAIVAASPDSMQLKPFEVEIFRQYPGERCTSGYLAVNGTIIAYSLERAWADNQKNVSSIPAGSYRAILRYDKNDRWRIQLTDVAGGRTGIQIHIGNVPEQSQGCIMLGEELGEDLCSITGSEKAYLRMKEIFYGSASPNQSPDTPIVVKISGATKPARN